MRSVKVSFVTLFLVCSVTATIAQDPQPAPVRLDEISKSVELLTRYFETYESETSDSEKYRKFIEAFTHATQGTVGKGELDQAFPFIDFYIRGHQGQGEGNTEQQQTSFDEAFQQTEQYEKASNAVNEVMDIFFNMSYPEFEAMTLQVRPDLSKREIKEAYNQIHKGSGREVKIDADDDQISSHQQIMWAIEVLEKPANFEEFSKALKIIDPKMSDELIQRKWNEYQVKQKK